MKADLARERAVWGEFGGASAEGGIHLVGALPGEAYPVRAVAAVEIAADRTEDELAASLRLEGDVGGLEQVYEIGVPQLHLGDPPPSEQWVSRAGIRSPAAWGGRRAPSGQRAERRRDHRRIGRPRIRTRPPSGSSISISPEGVASLAIGTGGGAIATAAKPGTLEAGTGRPISGR